jgi:acyl-CoA reductase-like NAD-dependent aldehyde dehydrogenase
VVEDATASNDPIHAAITKRYLQERSVIFRSSGEVLVAIRAGAAMVSELLVDKEPEVVTHTSPQNFERAWRIAIPRESDIDAAITIARKTFQQWRQVRVEARLRLVQEFGCKLEQHRGHLVDLLVEDIGKPIRYARAEVARAIALTAEADKQVNQHNFFGARH